MSNLVIKIKHNLDLSNLLEKAILIANYAIKNRYKLSSANVKEIGLPSAISNQILRKYGRQKKCKRINPNKIKLIAPAQSIKIIDDKITIIPLKINLINESKYQIIKINQIELDNVYAYVCFEQTDQSLKQVNNFIGVDLNATAHCAVVANPLTRKVIKLGKQAPHIHKKYKALRRNLQHKKLFNKLKQTKGKETNKVKDINHKISKKIVDIAKENNCGIKLEKLTNIRKNKKNLKTFRYTLNSWSYYQLGEMIKYKAQLQGIPVQYINPAYTSQTCSKCGFIGNRNGKKFKCANCKHIDHADANAAFNIANSFKLINSDKTEIIRNGETGTPIEQCYVFHGKSASLEPPML